MIDYGDMAILAPVEIHLQGRNNDSRYVVLAWVAKNGCIEYQMTTKGVGIPFSLTNLRSCEIFPRKSRKGWQELAVIAAGSGLYDVMDVF